MNSQIIRLAQNGHEFFLQYPAAAASLSITIDGRDVPATFHAAHDAMQKELREHEAAAQGKHDTKSEIHRLKTSLRRTAYAMERGVNAILDLTDRGDMDVDFALGTDFVQAVEQFLASLSSVQDIIAANPAYQASFDVLKRDFAAYQTAIGHIGEAKLAADTEKQQFLATIEGYEATISALHALVGNYLAKTDAELYAAYTKNLRHKKAAEVKAEGETVAQ